MLFAFLDRSANRTFAHGTFTFQRGGNCQQYTNRMRDSAIVFANVQKKEGGRPVENLLKCGHLHDVKQPVGPNPHRPNIRQATLRQDAQAFARRPRRPDKPTIGASFPAKIWAGAERWARPGRDASARFPAHSARTARDLAAALRQNSSRTVSLPS